METLEIQKSAAIQAHENANSSGRKLMEDLFGKKTFLKNVRDRINSWEDILEENGLTEEAFKKSCEGLTPDEIGYRKEKLMVAAYNGGKLPDWSDGTTKYSPWFKMGSPSGAGFAFNGCDRWHSGSDVGARLVAESREAGNHIQELFFDEYKDMMVYQRPIKKINDKTRLCGVVAVVLLQVPGLRTTTTITGTRIRTSAPTLSLAPQTLLT